MKASVKDVAIISIIIIVFFLFYSFGQNRVIKCSACRRIVSENMTYRITTVAGKTKIFCCPRCALRYEETTNLKIRHSKATDYVTAELVDARSAIYVEGSEMISCCQPNHLRTDNACFYKTWDRCSPSLVSFKTQDDAKKFQSKFGGKIISYEKLHQ